MIEIYFLEINLQVQLSQRLKVYFKVSTTCSKKFQLTSQFHGRVFSQVRGEYTRPRPCPRVCSSRMAVPWRYFYEQRHRLAEYYFAPHDMS